ncbi:hypothetical protein C8R44DRAFT_750356 [Mycena epipterygia]|nr:hypothetical protein C8R44DRAFT_750356 [Mycena epipterygia]
MAVINTVKRTRQMIKAIETQYDRVIHIGVVVVFWISGHSRWIWPGEAEEKVARSYVLSPKKGLSVGPVFDSSSFRILPRERRIAPRREINRPRSSGCVARTERRNLNYADDPAAQLCMYRFESGSTRSQSKAAWETYAGRGEVKRERVGGSGS